MMDHGAFYDLRARARISESNRYYQRYLRRYFNLMIAPGQRVLEMGCGLGDLLASVKPSRGVGVDISPEMIKLARTRHPELEFHVADAARFQTNDKFDCIILSDLLNDLVDVQDVLKRLSEMSHPRTRLVISFFNNLWRPVLGVAEKLGAKAPTPAQNWLSRTDVINLLHLAGWETIKTDARLLWPVNTPLIGQLLNRCCAPLLSHLCLTMVIIARPRPARADAPLSCSVVVPCRNEAGNIADVVQRTPEMGKGTEMILVEGGSTDHTWQEIELVIRQNPHRKIIALKQRGSGKGAAVREGFAAASGDLLFILDADLTVPPEELPKFYEAAHAGIAEFVNGVRLVYPMENNAMRFLNMVGNKAFSLAFSWLLGQTIKDTLCGTKVLFRVDYQKIAENRAYLGDFDPFGDFDLLFGASRLHLRIVDLPVHYRARTYGTTNIHRWKHGWMLLRMVAFAARRLKFLK